MTDNPQFSRALDDIEGIEGWLSADQARELWNAASALTAGDQVVEIGSFRGRSAAVIARAAPEGVAIAAIDPHAGGDRGPREIEADATRGDLDHEAFDRNLSRAGVRHRVDHIRKMSDDAHGDVEGSITMLYIDGAHRFGPARRDIAEWGDRVEDGGVMFIHDSFNSVGVTAAQSTTLLWGRKFRYEGRSGSLARYRRADLTTTERACNAGRQLAELPYFVWSLAIKAMITVGLGRFTRLLGWKGETWPY